MDSATAKLFVDALLDYVKSKVQSPFGKLLVEEAKHFADTLLDEFLKSPEGRRFTKAP